MVVEEQRLSRDSVLAPKPLVHGRHDPVVALATRADRIVLNEVAEPADLMRRPVDRVLATVAHRAVDVVKAATGKRHVAQVVVRVRAVHDAHVVVVTRVAMLGVLLVADFGTDAVVQFCGGCDGEIPVLKLDLHVDLLSHGVRAD